MVELLHFFGRSSIYYDRCCECLQQNMFKQFTRSPFGYDFVFSTFLETCEHMKLLMTRVAIRTCLNFEYQNFVAV
mgnify:CR=1 FL=1